MAAETQETTTSGVSSNKNVPYYIKDADLPDQPPLVRKLLEEYSKIPAAQVQSHVLEVVWQFSLDLKTFTWHRIAVFKLPTIHVLS